MCIRDRVSAKQWFNDKDFSGLTKTAYGIEKGWIELSSKNIGVKSPVIVIGSSPTALVNLLKILKNSKQIPSLIIGMPVGFIGVRQSKEKLLNTNSPWIIVKSTRGGAAMAAAAIKSMAKNTTGNSVYSAKKWINDKDLSGLTKTAYGIEKGWIELSAKNSGSQSPIIVIGSSPTALVNLLEIIRNSQQIPSLIIGMPVGFIGVRQSKNKLLNTNYPRIVMNSTRAVSYTHLTLPTKRIV